MKNRLIPYGLKCMQLPALLLLALCSKAQPYTELANFNHQAMGVKTVNDSFTTRYNNTFAGILLPVKIDSSNYFLFRANTEILDAEVSGSGRKASANVKSFTLGLGWQQRVNTRFTWSVLLMPKLASDFTDKLNREDVQMGGMLLLQYKVRTNFRYKAGLYYNREPFGNFFVPLLGVDVKLNERNWLYGQLPLMFRYEHRFGKKLYSGLGVRIFGRSYRLNQSLNHNYVFLQENQIKWFVDYYFVKNTAVYGEIGRTIGYGLKHYANGSERTGRMEQPMQFAPVQDGFYLNLGLAYRIRKDF